MFLWKFNLKNINLSILIASFSYFVFFLVTNFWLATTTYHSSYILVVYFCLAVIFSLPFVLIFYLIHKIDLTYINITMVALLWAFFEWLRLFFLSGYPFSPIGYFFCLIPLFQHVIGFFGIYGCSFVVVFFSLVLLKFVYYKNRKDLIYFCVFSLILFACPQNQLKEKNSPKLKVYAVQPGTFVSQKTYSQEFLETFMPLDDQLLLVLEKLDVIVGKNVDIVMLPEGVLSGFIDQKNFSSDCLFCFFKKHNLNFPEVYSHFNSMSQIEIFKALSKVLDATIIFGGNRYDENFNTYNSLIVIDPNQTVKFYDKRVLVPMGESLPFKWLENIAKRYGIHGFYESGVEDIITIKGFKVLPSVCYEDCFPLFKWRNIKEIPDIMINITNDGWFFPSSLPYIHANLSRLRVLELGIPMVRACEQSYSGWIRADGTSFLFDEKISTLPILEVSLDKQQKLYFLIKENWLFMGLLLVFVSKAKGILIMVRLKLAQKRKLV